MLGVAGMTVERLRLRHFRNYAALDLEFHPGKNILAGDNGQGKTNILESVYLCGTGSSYRTSREVELIRWGDASFHAASSFLRRNEPFLVEVTCDRNTGKKIKVNGAPQESTTEHIGAASIVIFGPDDLRIIKGGPADRRRFLDTEIAAVNTRYRRDLGVYRRVLMQRNAFLRDARYNTRQAKSTRDTALDTWDEQLVLAGTRVMLKRAQAVRRLSILSKLAHRHISSDGVLELVYRPSFHVEAAEEADHEGTLCKWSTSFRQGLLQLREEEATRGVTLVGPHRDELSFVVDGVDMRTFGSQGQQRAVLLSVRLAELEFVKSEVGEDAILLLDDVSSELDPVKRARLWTYISGRVQTIITTTDERSLGDALGGARVFRVKGGAVQEEER